MIDRKALWIAATIILAMIAINVWRLNLIPGWHHMPPVTGPDGRHAVSGLFLFVWPFLVFVLIAVRVARNWFVSGPDQAVQTWRRFGETYLIWYAVLFAVLYAVVVAQTLGYAQTGDPLTYTRISQICLGLLIMSMGNVLPKLPWRSARYSLFRLDPWQWNRYARLVAKLRVGTGLVLVVGGLLLPPTMVGPIVLAVWLTGVMAVVWYRIKLKREPPVLFCTELCAPPHE